MGKTQTHTNANAITIQLQSNKISTVIKF